MNKQNMNRSAQRRTASLPGTACRTDSRRAAGLGIALILCSGILPGRAAAPEDLAGAATSAEIDGVGRRVLIPHHPARVVALAPSLSEMLSAIRAWDLVVGLSDYCRVPEGFPEPARVGGLIHPDMERIVALKPDLVLATTAGNYQEDADQLERLGIPVYTLDTPSVASVLSALETMGRILGRREEAASMVRSLEARLAGVRDRVGMSRRPSVLFIIWDKPIIAPGRDAFVTEALSLAGARSISSESPGKWPEMDLEQIISKGPEVILTVTHQRALADSLPGRAEWAAVPAVRERRIHVVSDDIEQPGPRIVDGIEEVARILHPD